MYRSSRKSQKDYAYLVKTKPKMSRQLYTTTMH